MNRQKLQWRYRQITQVRFLEQVGFLIKVNPHKIVLQSHNPHYDIFYIAKRNGKRRLIENPNPVLKDIQRSLNKYLQCVYYNHCPDCSHGFIINIKRGKHRSIVSSARAHIGNHQMMNIDLKDFFHDVSQNKVDQIFLNFPFSFSSSTAKTLSQICCHAGRLPMGAPSSPVLSNLASLEMDLAIQTYCIQNEITYTRYVDDMCFSSCKPKFTTQMYDCINDIIKRNAFEINVDKVKLFGKGDIKRVTGIQVKEDSIGLDKSFFDETFTEIEKLNKVVSFYYKYKKNDDAQLLEHKQIIKGYINYASMIYGADNQRIIDLTESYNNAISYNHWDEPTSWKNFPYNNIM